MSYMVIPDHMVLSVKVKLKGTTGGGRLINGQQPVIGVIQFVLITEEAK